MADPVNTAADFLSRVLPFSELTMRSLDRLARAASIDFLPKGTRVMTRGETEVTDVLVIQSGGMKLFLDTPEEGEVLTDFRGEGGIVGALAVVRSTRASMNVECVEDTFVFRLPAALFLELVEAEPALSTHFLKSFTESYLTKAFAELRRDRLAPRQEASLPLFASTVGDVVRRAPVWTPPGADIRSAGGIMAEEGVGSLLVRESEDAPLLGIITDKDLRYKVVAQGLNYNWPVREIMNSPVRTIEAGRDCFEALLAMMRHQIHHLPVERDGRVIGVVTSHDIMVLQGRSPFALYREIEGERTFAGLVDLAAKVPLVVRPLVEEGAKASSVGRMVSVLSDALLDRVLTMLQEELGPPPSPFCWLYLGSEGRREQTFRTDQDNALLYRPPEEPGQAERARDYFLRLGRAAVEKLVDLGYPRCPFDVMASNPALNRGEASWWAFFEGLVRRPEPEQVLKATIFFDFRPGFGYAELGESLRERVMALARENQVFLGFMARDFLRARPPLSFFRGLLVEKSGEHKNRLDIKTRGVAPFVDFARLYALRLGLAETNTLARLDGARAAGAMSAGLHSEAREAYEFISQVRLIHQMRRMERGGEPDNFVDPAGLTDLERRTLKEAFSVISGLQQLVRDDFHLAARG
ncbi:putative nucleotidyltransferase substrate binding domain-containing protein [Desulfohalovibrio reitneri]|uniref:putative nucleotidyltransferase substrate binding domain-containing protein n=1 Tax=Desulfohalovibrio reitneri TaxID=1307759 RepID=UPI0004A731FA|nr:putative nucleotidyltransferase substrate binding domain-containing protein [Desulfohalovibrio reitneri]